MKVLDIFDLQYHCVVLGFQSLLVPFSSLDMCCFWDLALLWPRRSRTAYVWLRGSM